MFLNRSCDPFLTILRLFLMLEKPIMSASQKCIVCMNEFAYSFEKLCLNDSLFNCGKLTGI